MTKEVGIMLLSHWNFCSGTLFILMCLFEPFMWLIPQYFLWLPLSGVNDLMILFKNNLAKYWAHGSRALENHTWFSGKTGMLESVKPQRPSVCWWLWPAKDLCWKVQFCTEKLVAPQTVPVIVCNKLTVKLCQSPVTNCVRTPLV